MPRAKRFASGFTLLEIMIAVAIIAILSAIGYPSYTNYITRAKISEATGQLSEMRVKLEQYFQDNRTYATACAPGTVAPLPVAPAVRYFTYTCPAASLTATTFIVQADGIVNQGMTGFSYTIDQAGNRRTVSTGWGTCANTACWALRKDCSC